MFRDKLTFSGHFVQFPPTMLVLLLAMERPVLRPASPPVEYSPGLSAISAVLWQLLHAQLLQQLLLQQLLQLLSLSELKDIAPPFPMTLIMIKCKVNQNKDGIV